METLVLDLTNPQSRENALLELSKKRESFPELAPYLWHSFGTISALLQVIGCPLAGRTPALPASAPGLTHACGVLCAGDCQHIPASDAARPHSARLKPRLQCVGAAAVRGIAPGDAQPLPPGYAAFACAFALVLTVCVVCRPLAWCIEVRQATIPADVVLTRG